MKIEISDAIYCKKPKKVFFIVTDREYFIPIGYCYLEVNNKEGYLKALWVDEYYRRKKVATKLVNRVSEYAKNIGCTMFKVDTHPDNPIPKTLFRKMRFTELSKFQKSLL